MDCTKEKSKDDKRKENDRESRPSGFSIFDQDVDEDLKQLDVRERNQSF